MRKKNISMYMKRGTGLSVDMEFMNAMNMSSRPLSIVKRKSLFTCANMGCLRLSLVKCGSIVTIMASAARPSPMLVLSTVSRAGESKKGRMLSLQELRNSNHMQGTCCIRSV